MADELTLTINGQAYAGWTEIRVSRGLERAAGDFDIDVSERWPGRTDSWQIAPFNACTIRIGKDLVLTGFVDSYQPHFDKAAHGVRVAGRSKTEDLIDCTPEIQGGQYSGYALDAIAKAVAKPFGITVKVQTSVGVPFPDEKLQRCETAFQFIERLCRLRSVLVCDDETGALLLTSAGATRASGALVEGENILSARGELTGHKRFSKYIVLGQAGMSWDAAGVQNDIMAFATDPGCPRYRPHATMAESALDTAGAKQRAKWQAIAGVARGTRAVITVRGWRQPDGSLWRINQRIPVNSPRLKLDRELLVAGVSFTLNRDGRRTELTLGPVEAFAPDPGQVKLKHGRAGWDDAKAIK